MTTARALMRFAFAGLFVNFVAVACVVSDGDDDDDTTSCDPGAFKDCTCADGSEGTKKCNASGSGYGSCVDCAGSNVGGEGGGGSPTAGTAGSAGTAGTNGGETGSQGGAGAGGEASGGAGEAGAGGAPQGGAGPVDPGVCGEDPNDSCANCYQQGCCEEFVACLDDTVDDGDGDCATQFFGIMACVEDKRAVASVTSAGLEECAAAEVSGGSAWSSGLRPGVEPLIDCVAGDSDWEGMAWGPLACKASCFDK